MSADKKTVASSTDSVHAGIPTARPHHALALSIEPTATYTFENTAELERYMRGEDPDPDREEYGRYGNPTVCELERRVAELELAEDGVAFASGMAAITTAVMSLVTSCCFVTATVARDNSSRRRWLVSASSTASFRPGISARCRPRCSPTRGS
jgi:cystathionine beta-lyase/cystathionine gamma-synthase